MINDNEFLVPNLEWEYSDLPIKVLQLKFEKTSWGYSGDSFIEAWRDDKFRLKARIHGRVKNFQKHDDMFRGKGNIVAGQKITGVDSSGNVVELDECLL